VQSAYTGSDRQLLSGQGKGGTGNKGEGEGTGEKEGKGGVKGS